jgi:mRNA interferase RelE/StbE
VRYEVIFSPTAKRDMDRAPEKVVAAVIEFVYGDLAEFPRRVGKPLERELAGSYSARRGTYRILYEIDEEKQQVSVLRVAHRADVYRTS